jgi:hypothetical protein
MSKILELVFNTKDGKTLQLSIANPAENLTAETIQTEAASMIPALQSSSGADVVSLKSARYQTTSVEEIIG